MKEKQINPNDYLEKYTTEKKEEEKKLIQNFIDKETLNKLINSGLSENEINRILEKVKDYKNNINDLLKAFLESNRTTDEFLRILHLTYPNMPWLKIDYDIVIAIIKSDIDIINVSRILDGMYDFHARIYCNNDFINEITLPKETLLLKIKTAATYNELLIESFYYNKLITAAQKQYLYLINDENIPLSAKDITKLTRANSEQNKNKKTRIYGRLIRKYSNIKSGIKDIILIEAEKTTVVFPWTGKRLESNLEEQSKTLTKTKKNH